MDPFVILIILTLVFVILFAVAAYSRHSRDSDASLPFQYRPIAEARKADMERHDESVKEKEGLEQVWRFGMRSFAFMTSDANVGRFKEGTLPAPESAGARERARVLIYPFLTDDGEASIVLFQSKFRPPWLQRIDPSAFFRVVQILDPRGEVVFQSTIKFLEEGGKESCTGSILDKLEKGTWTKPLREALTGFEAGGS